MIAVGVIFMTMATPLDNINVKNSTQQVIYCSNISSPSYGEDTMLTPGEVVAKYHGNKPMEQRFKIHWKGDKEHAITIGVPEKSILGRGDIAYELVVTEEMLRRRPGI